MNYTSKGFVYVKRYFPTAPPGLPLTETNNPASAEIDMRSTREILKIIHREDQHVIDAVGAER